MQLFVGHNLQVPGLGNITSKGYAVQLLLHVLIELQRLVNLLYVQFREQHDSIFISSMSFPCICIIFVPFSICICYVMHPITCMKVFVNTYI